MSFTELFLIAVGLSMDAFAVSICKGLSVNSLKVSQALACGLWFGGFQFLMPVIGYFLGVGFRDLITDVDHWVAFALLALIGIGMIRESRGEVRRDPRFGPAAMLPLAVATSIDALAAGISFAFLNAGIWIPSALIGCTTFVLSAAGAWVGRLFGSRYKAGAEIAGGLILILIGLKILLEHLGIIDF